MRGQQHCDTTLLVEHRVPHCTSRELFKGVLDDEARGVFQGKIIVSPGAQKTDGKQMAGALLLSELAEFDSKPELEIFADDVVCGHGSTSGQIDEDLLFYLEARGIPDAASPGAADPGLCRRGARAGRGRAAARRPCPRLRRLARRQGRVRTRPMTVLTPSAKDLKAVEAPFDVHAIRADFPILSRKVHGKDLVYLDNGASAQKPKLVLDTIQRAYGEDYANVHRGLHYLSNLSTANFEKARESVRRFLNARSDAEIIFTRNATEAINLVASSYGVTPYRRGGRDPAHHHGAPLQYRALAFPARAAWRGAEMGAGVRQRRVPAR